MLKEEMTHSLANDLIFSYESEKLNLKIENIIEHCYKLDENVEPNVYKLLDLEGIIPDFKIENTNEENKQLPNNINEIMNQVSKDPVKEEFLKLSQCFMFNHFEI